VVASIGSTSSVPSPSDFTAANGALFFVFQNALWTSDGSTAGTQIVKMIEESPGDEYGRILTELTNVNGMLFFVAYASNRDATLWKSDGTAAGTVPVRSIQHGPLPASGDPVQFQLINVNGTLIFSAFDQAIGEELWKSNGTAGSTLPVKDIRPGTAGSDLSDLTAMHGSLFFVDSDRSAGNTALWKTDGTVSGTRQIRHGSLAPTSPAISDFYGLIHMRGTLFYLDNQPPAGLWRSDGTKTGTVRVKALYPCDTSICPDGLVSVDGLLFLSVWDGGGGLRLWRSAGLEASTVRVTDRNYSPFDLTNMNGSLFFSARDNTSAKPGLWKSDGTDNGTVRVKDTVPADPASLTNVDGTLFFSASDGMSTELWKSDGTADGTVLLRGGFPDTSAWLRTNVLELMNVNGTLFFAANDGSSGMELWKSDGTPAGTVLVKDIRAGADGSSPHALTNVNGVLFFAADDGSSSVELWKSDGTAPGTVRVKDINAGPTGSFPDQLATIYGMLFFAAYDTQNGYELWQSDGSEAGTVIAQDIEPGAASSMPSDITVAGNHLFFNATTTAVGRELWKLPITTLELRQPNLTLIPVTPFDPGASRTGVMVTNFSPIAATDVVLTMTLPSDRSFAIVNSSQGTCSVVGSTLTCQLGLLPGNSTATITTRITPQPVENTLLLATVAGHEADLDMADNSLAMIIWWPQVYLPHMSH
jgi:ELWxxDGT repeat protein